MIDAWKLANEIYNVFETQHISKKNVYLPHILEPIISYHIDENKTPRDECGWGCAFLDENKPDGWYDGYMCPTCGYVRGMNK